MRAATLAILIAVALAIAAPAAAGGYDRLAFEERYYRAGDIVRGEAGVSSPRHMPPTVVFTPLDGEPRVFAVVRAEIAEAPLTDRTYVDTEGGSWYAEYLAEVAFRLPALPAGEYLVTANCEPRCQPSGPWVHGTLFVVGEPPAHGPVRSDRAAVAS